MSGSLFREEVFVANRHDWLGSIRLSAPRIGWLFFGLGIATVVVILGLLFLTNYSRHARVSGWLVPSGGVLAISPTSAGIVARLLVREGDSVRAGQPLVEISTAQNTLALGNTQEAIAAQLAIKEARLKSDLLDQSHLSGEEAYSLKSRL